MNQKEDLTVKRFLICMTIMTLLFTCPLLVAGAVAAAETTTHTVERSDNLHLLAAYYYRDPRQWARILRANSGVVEDASVLFPGTELVIPGEGLDPFPLPYREWKEAVRN